MYIGDAIRTVYTLSLSIATILRPLFSSSLTFDDFEVSNGSGTCLFSKPQLCEPGHSTTACGWCHDRNEHTYNHFHLLSCVQ